MVTSDESGSNRIHCAVVTPAWHIARLRVEPDYFTGTLMEDSPALKQFLAFFLIISSTTAIMPMISCISVLTARPPAASPMQRSACLE